MAYARFFSVEEVSGMLQIYEGNHMMSADPVTHAVERTVAAAHAQSEHGGADFNAMGNRVNTAGKPRTTSTYWNTSDQALATTEALNSANGQAALATLDAGNKSCTFRAALAGNYKVSVASDDSTGALTRNDPARSGAGSTHTTKRATEGFVKAVAGINGTLQIQTSYPSQTA